MKINYYYVAIGVLAFTWFSIAVFADEECENEFAKHVVKIDTESLSPEQLQAFYDDLLEKEHKAKVENWAPEMKPPFPFGPWFYPKKELHELRLMK
jgi:hypothetical protein